MRLFVNNWASALSVQLLPGATELSVPAEQAALLPVLAGGDYLLLTLALRDKGKETAWEIIKVTAISGGVLTIERGQEGTADAEWPAGSLIEARLTAGDLSALRDAAAGGGGSSASFGPPRIPIGGYVDPHNNYGAIASGVGTTSNTVSAIPFEPAYPLTVDRMGISVATANASALFRLGIYDSGPDGWPAGPLRATADLVPASVADVYGDIEPIELRPGKVYWLVVHANASLFFQCSPAFTMNLGTSDGKTKGTKVISTAPFSGGLPGNLNPYGSFGVSTTPIPIIRMRRSA